MVGYNIPHPAFGFPFPKTGQRPGNAAAGKFQQRRRIFRPDIPVCPPKGGFVAGHFHILLHQAEGQPDQGVEPMNRQRAKGQQLDQMIPRRM